MPSLKDAQLPCHVLIGRPIVLMQADSQVRLTGSHRQSILGIEGVQERALPILGDNGRQGQGERRLRMDNALC